MTKYILHSLFFLPPGLTAGAADFSFLCADRAALERVYHEHRTGEKPPFDQAMPRDVLERRGS